MFYGRGTVPDNTQTSVLFMADFCRTFDSFSAAVMRWGNVRATVRYTCFMFLCIHL